MSNTYSQIYIHVVFSVRNKRHSINKSWKDELYKYITGIIKSKEQKLIVINGVSDHLHFLVGMRPTCNLSDLIREVKANSSKWINKSNYISGKFFWQEGFGAFSLGHSQLPIIINYINNQDEHHKKATFREEYIQFLKAYDVDYIDKYIPE
jgi:REP element-mobilizing transposase RayT